MDATVSVLGIDSDIMRKQTGSTIWDIKIPLTNHTMFTYEFRTFFLTALEIAIWYTTIMISFVMVFIIVQFLNIY